MIEMICPNCMANLEIDEGFRGGICRCFKCRVLMTVPETAPAPLEPPSPHSQVPEPVEADSESSDTENFITPSGRRLHLSAKQIDRAPVAHRHRRIGIHLGVAAVFVALAGLLIAGVLMLAIQLFSRPDPLSAAHTYGQVFDITVNPYTTEQPGFMGLPVSPRTVYLIDATGSMRSTFDLVVEAIVQSIRTLSAQHRVQIICFGESGVTAIADRLTPAPLLSDDRIRAAFTEITAIGAAAAAPAFARAVAQQPDQISFICRDVPTGDDLAGIASAIDGSAVRLVIIHLDGIESDADAVTVKALAEKSGGRYISLGTGQLRLWYRQFQDQLPSDDATRSNPVEDTAL